MRGVVDSESRFAFGTRRTVAALRRVQTGAGGVATPTPGGGAGGRLRDRFVSRARRLVERLSVADDRQAPTDDGDTRPTGGVADTTDSATDLSANPPGPAADAGATGSDAAWPPSEVDE